MPLQQQHTTQSHCTLTNDKCPRYCTSLCKGPSEFAFLAGFYAFFLFWGGLLIFERVCKKIAGVLLKKDGANNVLRTFDHIMLEARFVMTIGHCCKPVGSVQWPTSVTSKISYLRQNCKFFGQNFLVCG